MIRGKQIAPAGGSAFAIAFNRTLLDPMNWLIVIGAVASLVTSAVIFTLPSSNADTALCSDPVAPTQLTDLDSVFVWMQVRWNPRAELVLAASARGLEGSRMVVQIPTDSIATVWVSTTDIHHNASCASNTIGVNLVAGIPGLPPAAMLGLQWFDVAGRSIPRPTRQGVYFARRGKAKATHVVVVR